MRTRSVSPPRTRKDGPGGAKRHSDSGSVPELDFVAPVTSRFKWEGKGKRMEIVQPGEPQHGKQNDITKDILITPHTYLRRHPKTLLRYLLLLL